jgi:hypothetical protein
MVTDVVTVRIGLTCTAPTGVTGGGIAHLVQSSEQSFSPWELRRRRLDEGSSPVVGALKTCVTINELVSFT